jgi:HAD superfamily hydrolase (TIGR01458 family)
MDRPRGVLLDLDGTVYEQDRPIPGAADAVERLRRAGIGLAFCTNTTRMPRRVLRDHLASFGIEAAIDRIVTAPAAAASWLESQGIRRIALYVAEATVEEFAGFTRDDSEPEAVVLGDLAAGWTFEVLNRAFRQVLGGARLVALQRNRYWKTAEGLSLDAGPFVAALEYAAGVKATVVGKPSAAFFGLAVRALGVPAEHVVVAGDDVTTDVHGAQSVGLRAVLVRTGKYRKGDEHAVTPPPDAVVGSVAELPGLFGEE